MMPAPATTFLQALAAGLQLDPCSVAVAGEA